MNAARKGSRGERELAAVLSAMFNTKVVKGSSPYLFGSMAPDIIGLPGVHVEAKRRERLCLPVALRQSQQDAMPGDVPIVMHRVNGGQWVVSAWLCDLPRLALAVNAIEGRHEG